MGEGNLSGLVRPLRPAQVLLYLGELFLKPFEAYRILDTERIRRTTSQDQLPDPNSYRIGDEGR